MVDNALSAFAYAIAASVADRLAGPLKTAVAGPAAVPADIPAESPASDEDALLLPSDVKDLLDPVLTDLGFPLQQKNIRDTSRQKRNHYRAEAQGGYIAWLYLRNKLLENGKKSIEWSWVGQDFSSQGALGLFILSDADRVALPYTTMARQWERRFKLRRVEFLDDEFTASLRDSELDSRKVLVSDHVGDSFVPVPQSLGSDSALLRGEQDRVIAIVAKQATTAAVESKQYFKDLVSRTNWPQDFKNRRSGVATGDSMNDARDLINYAIGKNGNPETKGYTILGSLLEEVRKDVGRAEADELAELICKRGLITDPVALGGLRRTP